MLILGVDPGLQVTGYGLIEAAEGRERLREGGAIRSDPTAPLERRLLEIYRGLEEILSEVRPDVVAVEELYSTYGHPRTAILMGHARGVIYLAAAQHGIPVVSYLATKVKMALTGSGRASKQQVQQMVMQALSLDAPPQPADVADALALAVCHANMVRRGVVPVERGEARGEEQ